MTSESQKELVEKLKNQWKKLWQERVDDKVRAEGIAIADYSPLFVEQGTIIHATRDFKALNFKEILEKHEVDNAQRFIQPNPSVGGWNKFIKTQITNKPSQRKKRAEAYNKEKKEPRKFKKRGWLHA